MSKILVKYQLCPVCFRAVPGEIGEKFCPNDGARMLEVCQNCKTPIASPYARYCVKCGMSFGQYAPRTNPKTSLE